jgi:uncharacterized protein (TIGR00725 family)
MIIAVIGGGICSREEALAAEAIGRELAQRGAAVVCGGLGGVMEAVCRGAKAAGGTTVGILPGVSRHDANRYVDIPVVTGLGEARNIIVVRTGQAVIAVGGEYGTLSEIAYALKLGIPVVGLRTWRLVTQAPGASAARHTLISPRGLPGPEKLLVEQAGWEGSTGREYPADQAAGGIVEVNTPLEAVECALALAAARVRG